MDEHKWVVKAVCFDFDNTLQDMDTAFGRAAQNILGPFGQTLGLDLETIKTALNNTWPSVWEEFMAGSRSESALYPEWFHRAFRSLDVLVPPEQRTALVSAYQSEFERTLSLYPDVVGTLNRIMAWQRPPNLAILTNGPGERQRSRIRDRGLEEVIPLLVISEEVGVGKPHPEFFHAALRTLDVRPEDAVMIGDTLDVDLAGGRAVGMRTIWLNRRGTAHSASEGVDATVHDLAEAVRVMETWMGE